MWTDCSTMKIDSTISLKINLTKGRFQDRNLYLLGIFSQSWDEWGLTENRFANNVTVEGKLKGVKKRMNSMNYIQLKRITFVDGFYSSVHHILFICQHLMLDHFGLLSFCFPIFYNVRGYFPHIPHGKQLFNNWHVLKHQRFCCDAFLMEVSRWFDVVTDWKHLRSMK